MRGGGWLRLAAAALLPLALVNNALVNNAATCPRHHLLGMGDELREKGYIGLWHALHGMHVWINWLDHAPGWGARLPSRICLRGGHTHSTGSQVSERRDIWAMRLLGGWWASAARVLCLSPSLMRRSCGEARPRSIKIRRRRLFTAATSVPRATGTCDFCGLNEITVGSYSMNSSTIYYFTSGMISA